MITVGTDEYYTLPREERIARLDFNYTEMPKQSIVSCNYCRGNLWIQIADHDRYGYPATAILCRKCGLVTLNPLMTTEAYASFYQETYRPLVSAYHGRLIDPKTIQEEQREYANNISKLLHPILSKHTCRNMLDVGGSTGVVASVLSKDFGLNATIIDPSPSEILIANELGMRTITGFVENWEPDAKYDLIGMFQTIDHLYNLRDTLEKLRDIIAPDGIFIFDIVDFRAAYLREWSIENAIKIDHVYYLTEHTIENVLSSYGFDPIFISYNADHLHVTYICRPIFPNKQPIFNPIEVKELLREIRQVQSTKKVL